MHNQFDRDALLKMQPTGKILSQQHRSLKRRIVFGMSKYVIFLCANNTPIYAQMELMKKHLMGMFCVSRTAYTTYVKEIIGAEEYLLFQKRLWLCSHMDIVKHAKQLIDAGETIKAIHFLEETKAIEMLSSRSGSHSIAFTLDHILAFIAYYDKMGAFNTVESKNVTLSYEEHKKMYEKCLEGILLTPSSKKAHKQRKTKPFNLCSTL